MKPRSLRGIALALPLAAVLAAGSAQGALFGLIDTSELYTSTNGGATWTILATIPANDAVGIAAGASASELFMMTRSGSVYGSSNAGATWTAVGSVSASDLVAFTIQYDGSLLALTESGTLYRSTDGGATFAALAALTASDFVSLARGPLGRLYALTRTGEVYESRAGDSWTAVGSVPLSNAVSIRRKAAELYLLSETGEVYRSLNYGRTWLPVGAITASNMRVILDHGATLLAAAATGEVYTSSDGAAWAPMGAIQQMNLVSLGTDTPLATGVPVEEGVPSFVARAPYPNPTTKVLGSRFSFVTQQPDRVRLELYDVRGRRVAARRSVPLSSAGLHEISWSPQGVAAGTYIVRLVTESGRVSCLKWSLVE